MFSKVFHIVKQSQTQRQEFRDAIKKLRSETTKDNNNDGAKSKTEIAITIATRKYGRACSINSQTDTVSFPLLIHGEKCKRKQKKKTKKNHANESMQSQRGQNVKPSRDMNHRDSQRDSHAMSTRGALFTFSRLSAAPAPKR